MSVTMTSERQPELWVNVSNHTWRQMLELAKQFGWACPVAIEEEPYYGELSVDQADQFAAALRAAYAELPARDVPIESVGGPGTGMAQVIGPNPNAGPVLYFGGQRRGQVEWAIKVAEAGAFHFG